ncbi:MAG TPA: hypothetical protein VM577_15215 [Anaerovoracaceae bacterium]|nr:hypothetical protein [Anaerovoracaceae bacterium]
MMPLKDTLFKVITKGGYSKSELKSLMFNFTMLLCGTAPSVFAAAQETKLKVGQYPLTSEVLSTIKNDLFIPSKSVYYAAKFCP